MLLKSPWDGRQRDIWKCGGKGVLESCWRLLLQAADLQNCVYFVLQNPLRANPSLLCFRFTRVASSELLLRPFLLRQSWRNAEMRQSLFQVTSWLKNMGDLLEKHLRKKCFPAGFNIRPLCHLALNDFDLPADSHSWQNLSPSVTTS